jgi:hypothetical protein
MNSASMATNLLGRAVRLAQRPAGCDTDEGSIVLVSIKGQEIQLLVLVAGRLVRVESVDQVRILD